MENAYILTSASGSSHHTLDDPLKMSDPLPKPNWRELVDSMESENLIHIRPYFILNKLFILSKDI